MLDRIHGHLHDAWRRLALSIPGGWVEDSCGLTCMATGSTSPFFNPAISGTSPLDPHPALEGASDRYRQAELAWLLKLQPERDREMVALVRRRGIVLDEQPVYLISIGGSSGSTLLPPATLSIVTAREDTIDDAVRCFAEAFEADPIHIHRELGPNLLTVPSFTVFIGYLEDEPVATSMLATTPSVDLAGVYSVATRPSHRGRGFGTLLTRAALQAARTRGYDTAVLEPSPVGAAMYRRMGFEPFGSYLEAVM